MELENNILFWQKLDTLVLSSSIEIKQPKGSTHQKYPSLVYPCDYGYLSDNHSSEMGVVDIFVGNPNVTQVDTIIVSVDVLKKDLVVKVLLGCDEKDEQAILDFLNQTDFQKTILIRRGNSLPVWAESEN